MVGRLGVDINLITYYSIKENWEDKGLFYRLLLKTILFSALLSLCLLGLEDAIAIDLFNKPQLKPYIFWTALTIPFWSITLVCAGMLRAAEKNHWYAILNNPGRFFLATIAFLLLYAFYDNPVNSIIGHFYGVLALSVIAFLITVVSLKGISFSTRENTWRFLNNALPMMMSSTVLVLLGWLDTLVLGIYESDHNIGIYNVALKLATLTSFTLQAINSILAPKLAQSHVDGEKDRFNNLIRFTTKLNFFSTLGIVMIIVIFNKWLLLLFGQEFASGTSVLILLCLGQLINSVSGSVGVIMQMIGKQKVYQNIVLIALVVNIVLNFTLTPLFGVMGAATATVISIACWNIIGAVYLKRKLHITSYFNPFRDFRN